MAMREETTHKAVLKEWTYWYNELSKMQLIFDAGHDSTLAKAITTSNLTIASIKFMEDL